MEYITGGTLLDLKECDSLGKVDYIQWVWWLTCQFLNCQFDLIVYIDDRICCCWFKRCEEKCSIKILGYLGVK